MSGAAGCAGGYLCYVIAEGPVYGSGAVLPFVLAHVRTLSREGAVGWLVWQTRRVAERLDPEPGPGMCPVDGCEGDGPGRIRNWCDDPRNRRGAWERLGRGIAVSVVIPDGPDRYVFIAAPDLPPPSPDQPKER
ncbi:hypothetical protein ACFVIM_24495 [Streptomyces sp. NPDC057638]|uniref:hypothetical protein n=1 Tax=Streptomyces sp. NPDC057638 TaxID=3346190 RepID=UPI0036B4A664